MSEVINSHTYRFILIQVVVLGTFILLLQLLMWIVSRGRSLADEASKAIFYCKKIGLNSIFCNQFSIFDGPLIGGTELLFKVINRIRYR